MRSSRNFFYRLQANGHFSTFVVGTLAASLATGWLCFSMVKRKIVVEEHDFPRKDRPLSFEEARLQAMIENAQKSTWQENLDNAMKAQERFMLPNRTHETPAFVEKIDRRSREIVREQNHQQEELSKRTTKFWR